MKSQKEDIIKKVYEVALKMISQYGCKGFNMQKLANESSVAKATLYKIIGSKEDLFEKITTDVLYKQHLAHMFSDLLKEERSYNDFVDCFIEASINSSVGKVRRLIQQLCREYPTINKLITDLLRTDLEKIKKMYKTFQQQGIVRDDISVDVLEFMLNEMHVSFVMSEKTDEEVKKELAQVFRIFLDGMKKIPVS